MLNQELADYVLGAVMVVMVVLFIWKTEWPFFTSGKEIGKDASMSHILFSTAMIVKGASYFLQGWIYHVHGAGIYCNPEFKLVSALPGYVTAFAYSSFLILWANFFSSYFESAAESKYKFGKTLIYVTNIICSSAFALIIILFFADRGNAKTLHKVEAGFACGRDLVLMVIFLFFVFKFSELVDSLCMCTGNNFPVWICIVLTVILGVRVICILGYHFLFNSSASASGLCSDVIGQCFSEVIPFLVVSSLVYLSSKSKFAEKDRTEPLLNSF